MSVREAHGVAVQADDKIVVVGDVRNVSFITDFDWGVARYNTDGTLDSTFGTGGKVTTDFFGLRDQANDVAIQSDGKIVVAGYARTPTRSDDFALARFNTNGSLDSSFGTGGLVNTDVVPTSFVSQDQADSVKIQTDGRIVVTGFTDSRAGQLSADQYDFSVARYLTNGTPDATFNPSPPPLLPSSPGTLRIDFGQMDIPEAVAVEVDGKYVVAGSTNAPNTHNDNDAFALCAPMRLGRWIRRLEVAVRLRPRSRILLQATSAMPLAPI